MVGAQTALAIRLNPTVQPHMCKVILKYGGVEAPAAADLRTVALLRRMMICGLGLAPFETFVLFEAAWSEGHSG